MAAAIEMLALGVEAYLRELPDDEFEQLTLRVRPPKAVRYPAKRGKSKRHRTEPAETLVREENQ